MSANCVTTRFSCPRAVVYGMKPKRCPQLGYKQRAYNVVSSLVEGKKTCKLNDIPFKLYTTNGQITVHTSKLNKKVLYCIGLGTQRVLPFLTLVVSGNGSGSIVLRLISPKVH